jgi:hypothetical protein
MCRRVRRSSSIAKQGLGGDLLYMASNRLRLQIANKKASKPFGKLADVLAMLSRPRQRY